MDTTIIRSKASPYRSCIYGMVLSVCTLFTQTIFGTCPMYVRVPFQLLPFQFSPNGGDSILRPGLREVSRDRKNFAFLVSTDTDAE